MKNYEILKVSENASKEEIEASYQELRAKYSEDRFLEGEEGRIGAVNLMELEKAYKDIMRDFETKEKQESFGGDELGHIDDAIKANRLDEAQKGLDSVVNRTAKWHFFQSIVFYKRSWFQESKAQLQIAINLDPENATYKESMEKLERVIANDTFRPFDQSQTSQPPPQTQMDSAMGVANCCNALCCASLCCDLLQCL